MINECLAPNMKRKILQYLIVQDPEVKQFSKLSDFNASHMSETEPPIQTQNFSEFDYFYIGGYLQVNKMQSIVLGLASNFAEKLNLSSIIINLGLLRYSNNRKLNQSLFDFSKAGEKLPFNQVPPLTTAKMYLVLYPHINHLAPSKQSIQFKVLDQTDQVGAEIFLPMKYLPATHIDSIVKIGFAYPESQEYWSINYKYTYTNQYFSTKVLSNGVYISDSLISTALWKNILYPKNAKGKHTILKNWWKPVADLNPTSKSYGENTLWYYKIVRDALVEEASYLGSYPTKETYWLLDADKDNNPWSLYESITKVFQFCNLLSIKCGLEPYYEFIDISIDGSGNPNPNTVVWPKHIRFNSQANGFRLPTGIEVEELLQQQISQTLDVDNATLESYYQITQDAALATRDHSFLDDSDSFFRIDKEDVMKSGSSSFKLDQAKANKKIKEISATPEYKNLILRHAVLIDPKAYPTDQSIHYTAFVNDVSFNAKNIGFDYVKDPNTKKSKTILKIQNKKYHVGSIVSNWEKWDKDQFGFRVVKNKI
jgi:hypothetical protein